MRARYILLSMLLLSIALLVPGAPAAAEAVQASETQGWLADTGANMTSAATASDEELLFEAFGACEQCDATGSCFSCCICAGDTPQACRNTCVEEEQQF